MRCEQAHALISARLDDEIEPADRARLERHLAGCPACRAAAEADALRDGELRRTFAPRRLAVGQEVGTRPGERRRLALPDGSVLYLNQDTRVHLEAPRRLALRAGTIFLEVAPRPPDSTGATFRVSTPARELTALGTRFAVQ